MTPTELLVNLVATYEKHGWRLRRILLRNETKEEVPALEKQLAEAEFLDAPIDALWFSRRSQQNREAWELRLLGEPPYALFETFGPNDSEKEREEKREEMELRLREYVGKE